MRHYFGFEGVDELAFQEAPVHDQTYFTHRLRISKWPEPRPARSIHVQRCQVRQQRETILTVDEFDERFERTRFVSQVNVIAGLLAGSAQVNNLITKAVPLGQEPQPVLVWLG